MTPAHLKYVATLPCILLLIACILTLTFHKVVWQHMQSVMGFRVTTLLQIYQEIFRWKKLWASVKIMTELWPWVCDLTFWPTLYMNGLLGQNTVTDCTRVCASTMTTLLSFLFHVVINYWHCPNSMWSKVYETARCPSICLSQNGPTVTNPFFKLFSLPDFLVNLQWRCY